MEAQTAEETVYPRLSRVIDREPVIDLQMPASRNLAVNRKINVCMRGHGAAKMRHTYPLAKPRLFVERMLRQIS